jgi:sensor c-di-GMP phosphodiesterase-like protein
MTLKHSSETEFRMRNCTTLLHRVSSNIQHNSKTLSFQSNNQHNSKTRQEFSIFKTQTEFTQKDKDEILLALLQQSTAKMNSEYNSYSGFPCTDFRLADLLALCLQLLLLLLLLLLVLLAVVATQSPLKFPRKNVTVPNVLLYFQRLYNGVEQA